MSTSSMLNWPSPAQIEKPPAPVTASAGGQIEGLRPEAIRETVKQGHVRLVSDGKSGRSTFLLMPDGTAIPGIKRLSWTCEAGGRPQLVVEFSTVEVEIGSGD